jgi:hypothetical protein
MGVRRRIALVAAGIAWVVICLVLPPLVANWIAPVPVVRARLDAVFHPAFSPPAASRLPSSSSLDRDTALDADAPRRVDVYGNEIARPVARYRVDGRGTLYEVHSPQTEVPRLAPPRL